MHVLLKGVDVDIDKAIGRVAKSLRPCANGCMEWTGNADADGYGRITIGQVTHRVHRIVGAARFGGVPDHKMVLHTCDNPPCCNPDHLYIGTAGDNGRDKKERGRVARNINPQHGMRNGWAVLDVIGDSDIVRYLVDVGMKVSALAALLNVSHSACSRYLIRRNLATPPSVGGSPDRRWCLAEYGRRTFGSAA